MSARLDSILVTLLLFSQVLIPTAYGVEDSIVPDCDFIIKLTSPEPKYQGNFGASSVIINNTIVIGEPAQHSDTSNTGTVWFFDLNGNVTGYLKSPFKANASSFGFSMTVSEDYLIIGEPWLSVDGLKSAGMVHFYTHNGDYVKSTSSTEPMEQGNYGFSLSCNDDLIVVGEPGPLIYDENITSRVLAYDNSGSYLYTIQQSDARTGSFGMSLAVNNDTIIVGEPYFSESIPSWQGIIYMYTLNGSLIRNITSPFHMTSNRPRNFGFRVSASDNIFSVGEVRGNVEEHEFAGRAYIYNRNGMLLANLTSLQSPPGIHYGYTLVHNDLVLVEDYVRIENFTNRLGAVIYDKFGGIRAVVSSREYEWVRGFPIAFTDELVVLGHRLGGSRDIMYAGNVYVCAVPDGLWEVETGPEDAGVNDFILFTLIGVMLYWIIVKKDR